MERKLLIIYDHVDLMDILSASAEFKENIPIRPSDEANLVPVITAVKEEMDRRFGQKFEKSKRVSRDAILLSITRTRSKHYYCAYLKQYSAPYCHKVNVLLHAHLLRIDVSDAGLLKGIYLILLPTVIHLR
jgi:hypothetical protein